ncbi:MAG: MBG domain-containing protein, partial [Verrucomicrobiota bacterium]
TNLAHVFDGNGQGATAETEPAGLNVQFTYDGDSVLPTNAGLYEVVGTVIDPNYSGSATNTLTINPATLTVTANDETKFFGQADPAFTATYSGFVETDDNSVLNGTLTFTRESGEAVGLYAITPSGLSASNYQVNFNPGTLTIAPSPVPMILSLTNAGSDQFVITWSSVSNVMYQVRYRSDLASGDWIPLTNVTATNETAFATDNTGGAPQRFYQVIIPTP